MLLSNDLTGKIAHAGIWLSTQTSDFNLRRTWGGFALQPDFRRAEKADFQSMKTNPKG